MDRFFYACLVCFSLCCQVVLNGQIAPASTCDYTLQLFDSAANGWDGAYLEVSVNNGPAERYSITAAQGESVSYNFDLNNGANIDISYVEGANQNEHSYILLDALGQEVVSEGPSIFQPNLPTIKVECPETCIQNEDFLLLITMGDRPEEMSWELNDSAGRRVSFSNANAYNGFPPGFVLPISMSLSTCEAYTVNVFDGGSDGWNGGAIQLVSENQQRGNLISLGNYAGRYEVLSGPGVFTNQVSFEFTLPCLVCGQSQTVISSAAAFNGCLLEDFVFPGADTPTPLVCYPHLEHGNPLPLTTISYPTAIPPIANAAVDVAVDLPVGINEVIFNVEFGDGQMIRCTTEVNVVTNANPTFACNDNINVALRDIANESTCQLVLTPDLFLEGGSNCENEFLVRIFDSSGESLGNIIDQSYSGQVLDYQVQHIASLNSCWGTLIVEDKTAPHINCIDYSVACSHPNFLDENYNYIESYIPNDNTLPANIAGGAVAPSPPSLTTLPIEVVCGPQGEVVKNITVALNINHTEIGDLQIELVSPNGIRKTLMNQGTCVQGGAANMTVLFDSRGSLPSVTNSCITTQSPVVNGTFSPIDDISFKGIAYADLAGEWKVEVTDSNNTTFGDPVIGFGEVLNASINIEAGFVAPFFADDCSDFSVELVLEYTDDTNCASPSAGAVVNRLWRATDSAGNVSTCTQRVSLSTPSLSDVVLPQDIILECGTTVEVEIAGVPRFDCFEVVADQDVICDFTYLYEDTEVSSCGIGKKIFRDWTVINWCTTVSTSHRQIIEIKDTEGPTLGINDIVTGASSFTCGADIFLTALAEDACSNIEHIIATYSIPGPIQGLVETIIIDITEGAIVPDLPIGETDISISAMDGCGNSTEKIIKVTIEDDVTPFAVCDDELRLSLSSGGVARLAALDIDEGSRDNCEIVSYQVRRLEGCSPATPFKDFVEFECCDIDFPVNVELMVTDAAGNSATCWVIVNVEDKLAPIITCPSDMMLTCGEDITDLSIFGNASAIDDCGASIEETATTNIDNCGVGQIIRTFVAIDDSGNSSQCSQRISLSHVSDFTVSFPDDVILTNCFAEIDDLEEPIIGSEDCELIAVSHEDQVFELVQDACMKIVRTWTVINWCIYENDNLANTDLGISLPIPRTFRDDGDGFFQYTQVINIFDSEAPVIDPSGLIDVTVEIVDGCENSFILPNILASDACSGELDIQPNPRSVSGSHGDVFEVNYEAADGCGNVTSEKINVTFIEHKAPTPICRSGLIAEIDSHLKEVTIWALDFETGSSFDNCTPYEELQFSFSENVNDISKTFNCDQLGQNEVEIWVTDKNGNQDFCLTNIEVQDNLNSCDPGIGTGAKAIIGGRVLTQIGEAITDVNMLITGTSTASTLTDQNGNYDFTDLDVHDDYVVEANKNSDPLNGVSTFDLVLMARHILQVNLLDDPYRIIACDVDNSRTVNVFDMVALRQLILRAIEELPSGSSWTFVDRNHSFTDPSNPWIDDFETRIETVNLLADRMDVDFIGIKLGDVDNSAKANMKSVNAKERSRNTFDLVVVENVNKEEESITYSFSSKENIQLSGFQIELDFDDYNLNFASLNSDLIDINDAHISIKYIENGKLLVSWNALGDYLIDASQAIFELKFSYKKVVDFTEAIYLNSGLMNSEIYLNSNLIFDLNLILNLDNSNFELLQNKPNPFTKNTIIAFFNSATSVVDMKMFDLQGKLIYDREIISQEGLNEIQLSASDFNGAGIYYLQLLSLDEQKNIKLVLLE